MSNQIKDDNTTGSNNINDVSITGTNNLNDVNVAGTNNSDQKATELDRINDAIKREGMEASMDNLQDDIIRNDTIPETSRDTPGSSGAFPVGAFDTSKD
jgi:hypothetical protein